MHNGSGVSGFPNMLLVQDREHTTYKRILLTGAFDHESRGWQLVCLVQDVSPVAGSYPLEYVPVTYAILRRDPENEVARLTDALASAQAQAESSQREAHDANAQKTRVESELTAVHKEMAELRVRRSREREEYADTLVRLQKTEGALGAERTKLSKLVEVLGTDRVREILGS